MDFTLHMQLMTLLLVLCGVKFSQTEGNGPKFCHIDLSIIGHQINFLTVLDIFLQHELSSNYIMYICCGYDDFQNFS